MNDTILWLNDNSGALLVLITLAYVIATISISCSNKKSADASRQQIEASQKQQEQNVGLQLYSMRKDVIHKISQGQYNEVFWDIPLLFNDELFSDFKKVADKAGTVEKLQQSINGFEYELDFLAHEKATERIRLIREGLSHNDDIRPLRESVINVLKNSVSNPNTLERVEEYVSQVAESKELEWQCNAANIILIKKLRDFLKESIQ